MQKQKLTNKAQMKMANLCYISMTLAKISVDKKQGRESVSETLSDITLNHLNEQTTLI